MCQIVKDPPFCVSKLGSKFAKSGFDVVLNKKIISSDFGLDSNWLRSGSGTGSWDHFVIFLVVSGWLGHFGACGVLLASAPAACCWPRRLRRHVTGLWSVLVGFWWVIVVVVVVALSFPLVMPHFLVSMCRH